jgi:hypothetical protein
MPPQQPERLLDVINQTLSFCAHERSAATIQRRRIYGMRAPCAIGLSINRDLPFCMPNRWNR